MMEFEREMTRERIESGVQNAIAEGKWVGRPPFGFETDADGYLRVDPDPYIRMQLAVEAVLVEDRSVNSVAEKYRVPTSTLNRVVTDPDRRGLYLYGESEDSRLSRAVDEGDVDHESEIGELRERIKDLEKRV